MGEHHPELFQKHVLGPGAGDDAQGHGVTIGIAVVEVGADEDEEGWLRLGDDHRPVEDADGLEGTRLGPEPALAGHVPGQDGPFEHGAGLPLHQRFPGPGETQTRQRLVRGRRRQVDRSPGGLGRLFELEPDERGRGDGQVDTAGRRSSGTAPGRTTRRGRSPCTATGRAATGWMKRERLATQRMSSSSYWRK